MELLFGILLLAAIAGGVYLFNKGSDAVFSSLNRTVQKKTHNEGTELLNNHVFFVTQAPSSTIVTTLRSHVVDLEDPPVVFPARTYVAGYDHSAASIVWRHGTKVNTVFEAKAFVVDAEIAGRTQHGVLFTFTEGTTNGGVLAAVSAMRALKEQVHLTLKSVDTTVEEKLVDL